MRSSNSFISKQCLYLHELYDASSPDVKNIRETRRKELSLNKGKAHQIFEELSFLIHFLLF